MSDLDADKLADLLAKATPGPWVNDDINRPFNVYSDDATGSIIATVDGFHYAPRPYDEKAANAALIAMAPNVSAEVLRLRAAIDRADADKAAAVLAERERCAVIAETVTERQHIAHDIRGGEFPKRSDMRDFIAAAIRAGGE